MKSIINEHDITKTIIQKLNESKKLIREQEESEGVSTTTDKVNLSSDNKEQLKKLTEFLGTADIRDNTISVDNEEGRATWNGRINNINKLMENKNDYIKAHLRQVSTSTTLNVIMGLLLIGTLVYFLVFHKSPVVERYETEIVTLNIENKQLITDFESLEKEKEISKKITDQIDKGLDNINKELKSVNYEIYNFNKNRRNKEPFVSNLPNDSIAGELTKYLQRRKAKR